MKMRGVALAAALSLAAVATLTVFMYVRGLQENSADGGDKIVVLVSDQDIPAGSDLEALAAEGAFEATEVPADSLVRDAVSDSTELQGQVSSTAILAGEQLSRARFQGDETLPGGTLGIPEGHMAVTVALDAPRLTGGAVQRGDHVTIYGTFRDISGGGGQSSTGVTANLVPDVEVLKVAAPTSEAAAADANTLVTMALEPKDAQKLVFAQEQGTVYLGLLPPGEDGTRSQPLDLMKVLR